VPGNQFRAAGNQIRAAGLRNRRRRDRVGTPHRHGASRGARAPKPA
jgi:hypothetical protein